MNQPDTWEKEFDEKFVVYLNGTAYPKFASEPKVMPDIKDFIRTLRKNWLRSEIEKLESGVKTGNNGEGLPFENSPEIYGNARMEAWKNGHNTALTSIITRYKEELLELDKTNGL